MKKITPFSTGTDYMIWHNMNCSDCINYENESSIRSKAKCKHAYDIDFACIDDGTIPIKTAEWIGIKNGRLNNCRFKNIEFKPVKLDMNVFLQKSLF